MPWLKSLLSCFFPRNCIHCGEVLSGSPTPAQWHYLCQACSRQLRIVDLEHACQGCGVPLYAFTGSRRLCAHCRENPPVWGASRAFVRYLGPARRWVRDFKFHDATYLERDLLPLMKATPWLKDYLHNAVLIPVPLHPLKELMRGFNQSERLAQLLIQSVGNSEAVLIPALRRIRWTSQQARLRRHQRLRNVKNAFDINRKVVTNSLKSRRVIVVDDLLTTGSTLSSCVLSLRRAGFTQVDIITLARA